MYPLIIPVSPHPSITGILRRFVRHHDTVLQPPLMPSEVHVWVARPMVSAPSLHEWEDLLGDGERARLTAVSRESWRRPFVETHAVLRQVLARYAGVPPSALEFGLDARNQPELLRPRLDPPIHLGLVRSGIVTVVALQLQPDPRLRISTGPEPSSARDVVFRIGKQSIVTIELPQFVSELHMFSLCAETSQVRAEGSAFPVRSLPPADSAPTALLT